MPPQTKPHHVPYVLILVFALLSAGIGISGYLYFETQKRIVKQEMQDDLAAIADLKANEIFRWRKERIEDALIIIENPFIIRHVGQWLADPAESSALPEIYRWLKLLAEHFDYKGASLVDAKGTSLLEFPEGQEFDPDIQRILPEILRGKKPILLDPHRSQTTHNFTSSLVIPIDRGPSQDAQATGVLILRIDPYKFLYPFIQAWPTPSRTAETLLVRLDGDDVVYINELRHRQGIAETLRLPLATPDLPAAMAIRGQVGVVEGTDYRGAKVAAAIKAVQDAPWFLIAKMDTKEIYAPIQQSARIVTLVVCMMIVAAGIALCWIWNVQHTLFYRKQYEVELERRQIAERHESLLRHANDIILLVDRQGRIVEANGRASASYGYTLEELLQMQYRDLQPSIGRTQCHIQQPRFEQPESGIYETVQQRKDGTLFPVEISACTITLGANQFTQNIIRDISERKNAEEVLRQSEERYCRLFEDSPTALWELDCSAIKAHFDELRTQGAQDLGRYIAEHPQTISHCAGLVNISEVNRAGLELYQAASKEELKTDLAKLLEQESVGVFGKELIALAEGVTRFDGEAVGRTLHGEIKHLALRATVVPSYEDSLAKVLVSMIDITAVKHAKEALQKAHDELEQRVRERTADLLITNERLQREIEERKQVTEALRQSEQRLKVLSSQLLTVQENERKRIAGELHDSIGQILTAIKFGVENALHLMESGKAAPSSLESVVQLIQNAVEDVRRIYNNLRPSLLDDLGILATISWFCREFEKIYPKIQVAREIAIQEADVPESLKIVIFRVMQEAFHNITKYSHAQRVKLALHKTASFIELAIEDNGQGFDLNQAIAQRSFKTGLGLASMRERTELSDGVFEIRSIKGQGTVIRASWPLAPHPKVSSLSR